MIQVAICDDNEAMLDYLVRVVGDTFSESGITFEMKQFTSGKKFLGMHEREPFDVVFMDIIMPETDGFEAAKQIRRISSNTYIIFVTTESSLVYESFDFQPFYFIPKEKPQVLEERLKHVVGKLTISIAANEKVFIDGSRETARYISPKDIIFIKSSSNQITFHLVDGSSIIIRKKLSDFFAMLNKYVFARTHNRIVVNMKHIARVDFSNLEILLDNGDVVKISRGCKEEFKSVFIRYTRTFL